MKPASYAIALAVLVGCGAAALGCDGNNRQVQHAVVQRRAPFDFRCPRESLVVSHLGGDLWAVQGCGQRAVYNANGLCSTTENCDPAIESPPTPDGQRGEPR